MNTIIMALGWVLFVTIALTILAFTAAALYSCASLGNYLAARSVKNSRHWERIIRTQNYRAAQSAARTLRDHFHYGENASLGEIIEDLTRKTYWPTEKWTSF